MLFKRAALALFATRALFSLATPLNSFTVQVTVQDSSFSLKSDDTCSDEALAASLELKVPEPLEVKDPEIILDAATFVGIENGETHQFLGIPFAHPP
jgi:hypothetical protein